MKLSQATRLDDLTKRLVPFVCPLRSGHCVPLNFELGTDIGLVENFARRFNELLTGWAADVETGDGIVEGPSLNLRAAPEQNGPTSDFAKWVQGVIAESEEFIRFAIARCKERSVCCLKSATKTGEKEAITLSVAFPRDTPLIVLEEAARRLAQERRFPFAQALDSDALVPPRIKFRCS